MVAPQQSLGGCETLKGNRMTRKWNKKLPNFYKVAQKVVIAAFTYIVIIFKMAQNVITYLGYFCKKMLFPIHLKKYPNLVTLDALDERMARRRQRPIRCRLTRQEVK